MINVNYSSNTERKTVIFDENKTVNDFFTEVERPEGAAVSINGSLLTASELNMPVKTFTGTSDSCFLNALRKTDHN